MAFKTGTSYGFRDAVAAGVVGGYAIVVWTGRADGGARGGLTGHDASLPLLFDAADAIDSPGPAPRPIAPRGAPKSLARLARPGDDGPRLIFPPDGAAVRVEALDAEEAFITSATSLVMPVTTIDGHTIHNGAPGPTAQRLREIYIDYARKGGVLG